MPRKSRITTVYSLGDEPSVSVELHGIKSQYALINLLE